MLIKLPAQTMFSLNYEETEYLVSVPETKAIPEIEVSLSDLEKRSGVDIGIITVENEAGLIAKFSLIMALNAQGRPVLEVRARTNKEKDTSKSVTGSWVL